MSEYSPSGYSNPGYAAPSGVKYNVLAIVSLVLAFFISLGAIICGHIALSQIKKTGEKGRGLAIAGLVLGYIGVAVAIIAVIAYVGLFAATIGSGSVTTY